MVCCGSAGLWQTFCFVMLMLLNTDDTSRNCQIRLPYRTEISRKSLLKACHVKEQNKNIPLRKTGYLKIANM